MGKLFCRRVLAGSIFAKPVFAAQSTTGFAFELDAAEVRFKSDSFPSLPYFGKPETLTLAVIAPDQELVQPDPRINQ